LIARGSLLELDTQLWLARELGYSFDHGLLRTRIEALCIKLNKLDRIEPQIKSEGQTRLTFDL
jgi:hypothetical protein